MGKFEDIYITGGTLGNKPIQNGMIVEFKIAEGAVEKYKFKHDISGLCLVFVEPEKTELQKGPAEAKEETTPENVPFVPDLPPEEVRADESVPAPPKRGRPAGTKK